MRKHLSRGAFTLVELLVGLSLSGLLGAILYTLAIEAVGNFARNISVNKSYHDARRALEQIAASQQSAGHLPILVDANGEPTITSPAPGIRFYRYSANPSYAIQGSLSLSTSTFTVQLGTNQTLPQPGDLLTIDNIGFQAAIQSVSNSGSTSTLSFAGTIASNSTTTPTAAVLAATTRCLLFTQVAFIATANQLRYYARAKSVSKDGATLYNDPASYTVLANLVPNPVTPQQSLPFQLDAGALVRATICAQSPDYSQLGYGANTYSPMQASLGSRCPANLVRAPY